MSGNSFVVDTNIALYLLSGNATIADALDNATIYASFVTQLELLGYKGITAQEAQKVKFFLCDCIIVDINDEIKQHVIDIRQKYRLKLPDSIIAATSMFLEVPLFSADKEFGELQKLNLVLYQE